MSAEQANRPTVAAGQLWEDPRTGSPVYVVSNPVTMTVRGKTGPGVYTQGGRRAGRRLVESFDRLRWVQ